MGYIAPITNFTAMNYQARQIGDGMSPYYIEKPFKIVLKELSDKEERHGEEADRFNEKEEREKVAQEAMDLQLIALHQSQLTGKGGLFHDRV